MSEKAIQQIVCYSCGKALRLICDFKDLFNSDFYFSEYCCDKCDYSIKITTHELRD